jgi:hypothetical protein
MTNDNSKSTPELTPVDPSLVTAINDRDASTLRQRITDAEFIVISIEDDEAVEEDEALSALTAEIEDQPVLVAFTSEQHAGRFVREKGDMFEEDSEIQGFLVAGEALIEYLPEEYGMLLNPESDDALFVDVDLARLVAQA